MKPKYCIYYRTTARTKKFIIGKLVDNGAKKSKLTVHHDFLGVHKKGTLLKVPRDLHSVAVNIQDGELQIWVDSDPRKVERYMEKRLKEVTNRIISRFMQQLS